MRPSNKSRNRNKNNNRRGSAGNNINRVFESAGPEGRVRGTPQQIIDKYLSLTYDSQLSGDRVAAENFQQHAEHYSRLLIEAQKEIAEKQAEQNSNATVVNKTKTQLIDETVVGLSDQDNQIDKEEGKIVKLEKSIEKKEDNTQYKNEKSRSQSSPSSRKIVKKRNDIDPKTIEI